MLQLLAQGPGRQGRHAGDRVQAGLQLHLRQPDHDPGPEHLRGRNPGLRLDLQLPDGSGRRAVPGRSGPGQHHRAVGRAGVPRLRQGRDGQAPAVLLHAGRPPVRRHRLPGPRQRRQLRPGAGRADVGRGPSPLPVLHRHRRGLRQQPGQGLRLPGRLPQVPARLARRQGRVSAERMGHPPVHRRDRVRATPERAAAADPGRPVRPGAAADRLRVEDPDLAGRGQLVHRRLQQAPLLPADPGHGRLQAAPHAARGRRGQRAG